MIRITLVFTAALLVFAAPSLAQDATVADPDHYTVEFENEEVRVLRITYAPGEKSVMHEHPDAVAIMLTDGAMVMHSEDGEAAEMSWGAGDAMWTPAVKHMPENVASEKVVVILVEMKDDHGDDHDHDDGEDHDRD